MSAAGRTTTAPSVPESLLGRAAEVKLPSKLCWGSANSHMRTAEGTLGNVRPRMEKQL